jgi:hypothetical protein
MKIKVQMQSQTYLDGTKNAKKKAGPVSWRYSSPEADLITRKLA